MFLRSNCASNLNGSSTVGRNDWFTVHEGCLITHMKFWKYLTFLTLRNSPYDPNLRHFRLTQEAESEHISSLVLTEFRILSLSIKNWLIYRGLNEYVDFRKSQKITEISQSSETRLNVFVWTRSNWICNFLGKASTSLLPSIDIVQFLLNYDI